MPNQVKQEEKKIIFPDGSAMEISTDGGLSYTSIGVFEAGVVVTYNYDKIEVESGNAGDLLNRIKNEKMALAPSNLLSWDPEVWKEFMAGAFEFIAIAGVLVPGATQAMAALSTAYQKFIKIENQNFDLFAITVNSVTGATDGAYVLNTDYRIGQNEKGEYGIFLIAGGAITTLDQIITIDYDYTPASGKKVTAGRSSLVLVSFMVRIRHYTDDALTLFDREIIVYSADPDSGVSFNEKGANEDGVNSITAAFTAKNESGNTEGNQLFSYYIADAAYGE